MPQGTFVTWPWWPKTLPVPERTVADGERGPQPQGPSTSSAPPITAPR